MAIIPCNPYQNMYLNQQLAKAQIDVYEKQEIEKISIEAVTQKAMRRADVASLRELQKMEIIIKAGQKVQMSKQLFGNKCYDEAKFSVLEYYLLACIGNEEKQILFVRFQVSDQKEKDIYFWKDDLGDRTINRKLNSGGINFGFSHAKETTARRLMITKLIEMAPIRCVPPVHGWYEENGEIKFSYPNKNVWKEIMHYA